MSRYHLHVVGRDTKFRDKNGQTFDTLHDATARATRTKSGTGFRSERRE
jgi:hypothetical protein